MSSESIGHPKSIYSELWINFKSLPLPDNILNTPLRGKCFATAGKYLTTVNHHNIVIIDNYPIVEWNRSIIKPRRFEMQCARKFWVGWKWTIRPCHYCVSTMRCYSEKNCGYWNEIIFQITIINNNNTSIILLQLKNPISNIG